jgi:hypothetical protein
MFNFEQKFRYQFNINGKYQKFNGYFFFINKFLITKNCAYVIVNFFCKSLYFSVFIYIVYRVYYTMYAQHIFMHVDDGLRSIYIYKLL